MPRFVTRDLKGQELYFDLRLNGTGDSEGFWATPIFASDETAKKQELQAKGLDVQVALHMLIDHVTRWVGFTDMAGKEIPCNEENIRALWESDFITMFDMYKRLSAAAAFGQLVTEKN